VVDRIGAGDVAGVRGQIETGLWLSGHLRMGHPPPGPPVPDERTSRADLHRDTGVNLTEWQIAAFRSEPLILTQALPRRTGETLTRQPDLAAMTDFARAQLS